MLFDRDSLAAYLLGKKRLGNRDAVLNQNLGRVQVDADVEALLASALQIADDAMRGDDAQAWRRDRIRAKSFGAITAIKRLG